MMNGKGKRLLSLALALLMLSTLLPAAALAGDDDHGLAEAYFFSGSDWSAPLADTLPLESNGSVVFCVSALPAQSEDVPPGGKLTFLSIYNEEGTGDYLLYEGTTAYYGGTYDEGGLIGLTIPNVAEGVYSVKLLYGWSDGSYKGYVCDKAVTIGAAGSRAPRVTTTSLKDGEVGEIYWTMLDARGGSNAYTWSVSGKLPDGLTLEATTGILSGTPKKAGYYTFNVICSSVVDGETLQSKPCTLSLNIKQTFLTLSVSAAVTDECSRSVAITRGDTLIRSRYLGSGAIPAGAAIFNEPLEPGSYTATLTGANSYGTTTYGHVDFTFPAEMDVTIPLSPELIVPTEGVVVAQIEGLDDLAHYNTLVRLEVGGYTSWHYAEACTVFRGALQADDTKYTATLGFYDARNEFVPLASETVTITDGASRICTLTPDWNVLDNYREYALRTLPDDGALSVSLVLDGTPIYTNNYSRYLLHRDDAALAAAGKLTAEVSCGAEALRTRYDFSRPTATLDSSSASILVALPELDRSAAVGGKVTSGGKAVPGVSITASQSVNGSELSVMTVSGADGSYTLRGLVSGASAYVTAAAEGYQTAALTVAAPGAETTGADFDLTPQAAITVFLNGSAVDARISLGGGSPIPCGTGGVFTVPVAGDGSYTVSLTAANISGAASGTAAVKDGAGALTLYADFYGWLDFSGVNTGSCITMIYQGDKRIDCYSFGSLSTKSLPAGDYTVYFVKTWAPGKPAAADILAQTDVTVESDAVTKVVSEVGDGSPAASGSVTGPAEAAPGEIYKVTGVLNEVSGKEFFLVFQTPRASIQSIVLNGSLAKLHSGSGAQVSVYSDDNPQVDWTLPMTFTVYVMQGATEAEPYQMLTVQAVCDYQYEYIGGVTTKYVPGLTLSAGAVVGNAGSGNVISPGSVPFYGTAPVGSTVYLYDNGALCAVAKAKDNGRYEGTAALQSTALGHTLRAELHEGNVAEGAATASAEASFCCDPYGAVLTGITLNGSSLNLSGKPSSYVATPTMGYTYQATFDNPERLKDITATVNGVEVTGKVFFLVSTAGSPRMLPATTSDGGRTWTSSTAYFGAEYPTGVKVLYSSSHPDFSAEVDVEGGAFTVDGQSTVDNLGYTSDEMAEMLEALKNAGDEPFEVWSAKQPEPETLLSAADADEDGGALLGASAGSNGNNDMYAYVASILSKSLTAEERSAGMAVGVVNPSNAQTIQSDPSMMTVVTYVDEPTWSNEQHNVNMRMRELQAKNYKASETEDESGTKVFVFQRTLYYDDWHNPSPRPMDNEKGEPIGSILCVTYFYVTCGAGVPDRTEGGKWYRLQTAYLAPKAKSPIHTFPTEIPNSITGPSSYTPASSLLRSDADGSAQGLLGDASGNLGNYDAKYKNQGYWITTGWKNIKGKTWGDKAISVGTFGIGKKLQVLGTVPGKLKNIIKYGEYTLTYEGVGLASGSKIIGELWSQFFGAQSKDRKYDDLDTMFNRVTSNLNYYKRLKEWLVEHNNNGEGAATEDFRIDIKYCEDMIRRSNGILEDINKMGFVKQSAEIDDAYTEGLSDGLGKASFATGFLGEGGPEAGYAMDDYAFKANATNDNLQRDVHEEMCDFAVRYTDYASYDKQMKDFLVNKQVEWRKQFKDMPEVLQMPDWVEDDPLRPKDAVTEASHDPSGVVYEAVLSNPVQGATVTLYQRAGGGDALWDDSDGLGQSNPVVTGADGRYSWDVPVGEWFVTASAPGYASGDSGADAAATVDHGGKKYLPVLPPQLDVNIPLTDDSAPTVANVSYSTEGILVTFSKYMVDTGDGSVLSAANYSVTTRDGNAEIQAVTAEEQGRAPANVDPLETSYTRSVFLALSRPVQPGEMLTLRVGGGMRSYAGTALAGEFTASGLAVPVVKLEGTMSGGVLTGYRAEGVPEGATLIAACYSGGRMLAAVQIAPVEAQGEIAGLPAGADAWKLFLLDGETGAPLCRAWSSK